MNNAMKVGFVGLGSMGLPMAELLASAGHELCVYNRTHERAQPLHEAGARIAATPAEAARDADVVFSMLADDAAVEAVSFGEVGILAGLGRGKVHVSSSTISVALSDRLTLEHATRLQGYVAAPVFGRPAAAAAKQLWVLAAGKYSDVHHCLPLLTALGRGLTQLGEKPSAANVVKLSGNFLIASMIEALGEAFALTRKAGVAPDAFLGIFSSVFGQSSAIFENYAKVIASEAYEPAGFKATLGSKDMRLALDAAEALLVPLPGASLLREHFLTAIDQGKGELDWSVLAKLAAERAGL
jgi:3-hydroxyisobutyrate dehydrogenase-like beta-hydroxyacid dehydrogenase